jgi:hypothetical protein
MSTWASKRIGGKAAKLTAELEELLERDEQVHPLYLRRKIMELEEVLHLQRVWQFIGRMWLVFGNTAIWAVAITADALNWARLDRWLPALYWVAIVSSVISPLLVYWQYKRVRQTQLLIRRLNILRREKLADAEQDSNDPTGSPLAKQRRYRDEMPEIVGQFRDEANRSRRVHNRFQTVIIVGSICASAITTASVSFAVTRWISVVVTAMVGLAAGFTGYFKYHERSFNLQQTADAIEREYEAVELRVGRYANMENEKAFSVFADTVERLRDEQNKRQQQLDQPVEIKREE